MRVSEALKKPKKYPDPNYDWKRQVHGLREEIAEVEKEMAKLREKLEPLYRKQLKLYVRLDEFRQDDLWKKQFYKSRKR